MHGRKMNNDEILKLCLKTFDEEVTVSLPNGRFFPSTNAQEREMRRRELMKKILDYGKGYVVIQNDNRGLVLNYLN